MVAFGYSLLCEQRGPRELIADAVGAEDAGFDFAVISDHCSPWLDAQGHAPNAWPVLGAVAAATERMPLMTCVTCPTMRYHPVVVAQKAATVALLAGDGRFCLGLGAGENLNEHVVGAGWPPVNVRHEMLGEAVEPLPDLVRGFDAAAGTSLPKIGQLPIGFDPDRDVALDRAHAQSRWFAGGWKVNAELPGTAAFAAATQFVTPDDVAAALPCGPDVVAHVEAVRPFVDAGFTHVALIQVGGDTQPEFLAFAERELLPALREEYGSGGPVALRVR